MCIYIYVDIQYVHVYVYVYVLAVLYIYTRMFLFFDIAMFNDNKSKNNWLVKRVSANQQANTAYC